MSLTQRQYDRVFTTLFVGLSASALGMLLLWLGGSPWFVVPSITLYAVWSATGFNISAH